MRQKSEVFNMFRKFKCLVEKQSGCFIKVLRSDIGKEYTSNQFYKLCRDEGVERQLTISYTPQQNGVSERKNQTVMEMAKSMSHEKGLPKSFWAKAVYIAVYLMNRCPIKACEIKHHLKLGVEESHQLSISKCLVVFAMFKFQRRKDKSWMRRVRSVYLLDIAQCQRAIGCTT
jgi:transposase InsO family protein